jgi:hypothetical protein
VLNKYDPTRILLIEKKTIYKTRNFYIAGDTVLFTTSPLSLIVIALVMPAQQKSGHRLNTTKGT